MSLAERAREIAVAAHGDQKYGDEPYSVHLDEVAAICAEHGEEAQVVAYLHDVFEDTELDPKVVVHEFGMNVHDIVAVLTDPAGCANRKERKAISYAKLGCISPKSPRALALVVKAADRLANVRRCVSGNPGLLEMYRQEQPAFESAVRRDGLNDRIMDEIAQLLS